MSRGLNKVMIIGYLGKDPEMRYTPSGSPVTTFNVATDRSFYYRGLHSCYLDFDIHCVRQNKMIFDRSQFTPCVFSGSLDFILLMLKI